MKKTVYDRLKSLVGLQGKKVLLLGDYSRGDNVWLWMCGQCPRLGGLRWVDPREGHGLRDRDSPGVIFMQNIETVSRRGMVIKTPNLDTKSLPRSATGH